LIGRAVGRTNQNAISADDIFGAFFGEAGANAFASVAKTSKVETRRGLANDQTVEHG
jgi:hypothetical protein